MDKNSENSMRSGIYARMREKETDELLQIRTQNDHSEWTDAAFSVIEEILSERLGEIPPQAQKQLQEQIDNPDSREAMNKNSFMIGWLVVNLLGWMIGVYSGSFRLRDIVSQLESLTGIWQLPDAIGVIFVIICIPLAIGMGIMQCLQLGHWKIPAVPWILATAFGWIIPAMVFSRARHLLLFETTFGSGFISYLSFIWILYPVGLLIVGAEIGLFQSLVMGQSISKPGLWISANAVGLLAFGLLMNGIFRIPMSLWLGPISFSQENYDSLLIPPDLLWLIIWIILPFLATLITALPTGIVLLRYGNRLSDTLSENAENLPTKPFKS